MQHLDFPDTNIFITIYYIRSADAKKSFCNKTTTSLRRKILNIQSDNSFMLGYHFWFGFKK